MFKSAELDCGNPVNRYICQYVFEHPVAPCIHVFRHGIENKRLGKKHVFNVTTETKWIMEDMNVMFLDHPDDYFLTSL